MGTVSPRDHEPVEGAQMSTRPTTTPSASTGRSTSISVLRRRTRVGRGAAATDACGGPSPERHVPRTAIPDDDVLLPQMTAVCSQSSGGQRSPRGGSTSSIDVVKRSGDRGKRVTGPIGPRSCARRPRGSAGPSGCASGRSPADPARAGQGARRRRTGTGRARQ